MISPDRHFFFIKITAILVIAVSAFVLYRYFQWQESNPINTSNKSTGDIEFVKSLPNALNGIKDIVSYETNSDKKGELSCRFRLAGTILGVANSGADEPMAVIDDRIQVVQKVVRRNDLVAPGILLVQVKALSAILRGPAGDEEIFIDRGALSPNLTQETRVVRTSQGEKDTSSFEKFKGGEVFPGRWEFERGALLNYYSELRDEPERLLAVFDSLDPLYEDNDGHITGYQLNVKGEADFFSAAGMKEGDKVRSVNSVPMTNRRRAEAFISAFVEGNATTFVMEIERDGKLSKRVYVIE